MHTYCRCKASCYKNEKAVVSQNNRFPINECCLHNLPYHYRNSFPYKRNITYQNLTKAFTFSDLPWCNGLRQVRYSKLPHKQPQPNWGGMEVSCLIEAFPPDVTLLLESPKYCFLFPLFTWQGIHPSPLAPVLYYVRYLHGISHRHLIVINSLSIKFNNHFVGSLDQ